MLLNFNVNAGESGTFTVSTASNAAAMSALTPVPVPAAVWLFGSAIAGLIGFSRRKV